MTNNQIIKAKDYETGELISVRVRDGRIIDIERLKYADWEGDSQLPFAGPGLVDLQVNGYKGVDFNTPPIKAEQVLCATKQLWREGITTYFPTVITNSSENIVSAVSAIVEACQQYPMVDKSIGGIHLEGPFISPEDGPRGAHNRAFIQAPDWAIFQKWQTAAQGRIKLITLSPEWDGSVDFIRKCVNDGIVVSIGHTAASSEQIEAAVAAGANMSTHLGNGAHVTLPRHPNYIWDQLANDRLWACVIADGFHLPDAFLKVVFKVKGAKAMLVSDSVSLAGVPPGEYDLHIGGKVVLTEAGRLHMASNPKLLAGSAQTLLWGINHLIKRDICSLPRAWQMASVHPLNFIQLDRQKRKGDFVLFTVNRRNRCVEIWQTYKNGQLVYEKGKSHEKKLGVNANDTTGNNTIFG